MPKYVAESRYIASIYPGQLEPIRLYHGPSFDPKSGRCTMYRIPPVPRGDKPFVLEVSDAFETVLQLTPDGSEKVSKPVVVDETVKTLLHNWAENIAEFPGRPGVMEIAGPEPTEDELRQMREQQTVLFEALYHQGKLLSVNDWKRITEPMRMAGTYLGRSDSWLNPENSGVECPACAEPISSRAAICKHCGYKIRAVPGEVEEKPKAALIPDRIKIPQQHQELAHAK